MWGRDLRGNSDACSALGQLSVTSPTSHKQIGPFWCWFPSGWACVRSRTLWVSPRKSPVRLGVSPVASTPTGVFSQMFWGLFPYTGTLGYVVWLASSYFSWFICTQMWDHPLHQLPPCPPWSSSWCFALSPVHPGCPSPPHPPGVDECFFFISLLVRFPYSLIFWKFWLFFVFKCCCPSFGCARRQSLPMPSSWLEVQLIFHCCKEVVLICMNLFHAF